MPLRYLLDTDICIYITKRKPMSVFNKFEQLDVGSVGMSVVTYGELVYGVGKSSRPKKTMAFLEELIGLIPPLPLSTEVAKHYGKTRNHLAKKGKPIGNNDIWIASHALAMGLILVTNNQKEFLRVPKLKIENWVE